MKSFFFKFVRYTGLCGVLMSVLTAPRSVWAAQAEQFPTPEAAVKALTAATLAKDTNALDTIFGPESRALVSADPVQASNRFALFVKRLSEIVNLNRESGDKIALDIGNDAWPFPIPLVRHDGHWSFDTAAGREEILNRRIGMNELGAIAVCRAYLEAQREYAGKDRLGDGVLQYAQYLRSNPGKHDGLYWRAGAGEEISPFGPLIAAAHGEGYRHDTKIMTSAQKPYHGYYFKILTRQGRHAAGGKYSYIINGRMIAGFALVAWPAQWDNSGIMTFIVNQQGKIFERNLGPKTAKIAGAMTAFDPDPAWQLTREP
ncbi:MAG: DUF2950 domain-containing protein [Verrucomicrobiota bacterium]|jgi:hypothetical protein